MRNNHGKLSEIQRLACIALDSRGVGAVLTDAGWIWRSDCVLSEEAAYAVARKYLADGVQLVDIAPAKVDNSNFAKSIQALNEAIAGLLPEFESPEETDFFTGK